MRSLLDISDAIFLRLNDFARTSGWLHAPDVAYAKYGLVVFAALLLVGVWQSRRSADRQFAAAIWAAVATLLAVAVNQPVAALVAEARPYAAHPSALLRNQTWAYPWMIGFLLVFIGYQPYLLALSPALGLAALTLFDALIVWLTWREWRRVTADRAAGVRE